MPLTLLADSACDICAEEYDSDGAQVPSFIPCGHVVCRRCLGSLQPRRCPYCRTPYDWSDVRALVCDIAPPVPAAPAGALFGLKQDDDDDAELEPEPEPVADPEPTRKERENAKAQRLLHKLHDAFHKEREAGDDGRLDRIGEKRVFKSRRFLDECEDGRDYLVLEQATLMLQGFLDQREQHKQNIESQVAHRFQLMKDLNESWQLNIDTHYTPRIEELERKLEEAERKLRERQAPPTVTPLYYPQYSLASRATTPYAVPAAPSPILRSFHQIPATNDHNPMPAVPSIHGGLRRGMRGASTPDVRSAASPYAGRSPSPPPPVAGPSRAAYPQRDRAQVDSIPLLQPPPSARHFSPQPAETLSRHFSSLSERDEPAPSSSRHYPYPDAVPVPSSALRRFSPVRSEAGPPPRAPTLGRRALPSEEELARRTAMQPMREHVVPAAAAAAEDDDDDSAGFAYSLWRPGAGNVTPDVFVAPTASDLPPRPGAHRVSAYEFDDFEEDAPGPPARARGVVYEVGKGLRDALPGEVLLNRYAAVPAARPGRSESASPARTLEHYRTRSREAAARGGYQDATVRRAPGLWSPMDSDSDAVRGL